MPIERRVEPVLLRACGLGVTSLLLSVFAWWPALSAYPRAQAGDGIVFHKMLEAARVSVVRFHELPLWNPFECGGLPLWDNPQGLAGAPLAWIMLSVGTTRAVELWLVVHGALGFVCMWLLARHELRLSRMAAFVASGAWAFSGFHQQHYAGGHIAFVAFQYFPLAFLLWRRAETDRRAAIGLGALVAWMLYEGAVYPVPHLAVLLAAETLTRTWPVRRLPKIALAGVIAVAFALCLGGARLLPVLDQLRTHPRPIAPETDAMTWDTLTSIFVARHHDYHVPGQTYVWPEYGSYLGPIVLVLAFVGIALAGLQNAWMLAPLALAFLLMLGHAGTFAPWTILKGHVFPFKEMRVPSRFCVEVSMFLAAFAGLACDRIGNMGRRYLKNLRASEGLRTVVFATALIGVGDILGVGLFWMDKCFTQPAETRPPPSTRLYLGGPGMAHELADQPQQNRGRLQCWEEWGFGAGAPLWEGDVPQARATDDGAVVEVANRTPNTFSVDVTATRPTRIRLNTSYDLGWRSDLGKVIELDRQLALELPPGRHHVRMRYWPRLMTAGIGITGLGMAAVVLLAWRERRRTRAQRSSV